MSWPTPKKAKRVALVGAVLTALSQLLNVQIDPQVVSLLVEVFKLSASW